MAVMVRLLRTACCAGRRRAAASNGVFTLVRGVRRISLKLREIMMIQWVDWWLMREEAKKGTKNIYIYK